jgi:hypothetical protein
MTSFPTFVTQVAASVAMVAPLAAFANARVDAIASHE